MKRLYVPLLVLCLLLTACNGGTPDSGAEDNPEPVVQPVTEEEQQEEEEDLGISLPGPVSKHYNNVNLSVDAASELLSVIQYLSDYREQFPMCITHLDTPYKSEIDEYFQDYLDHPAIVYIEENIDRHFTFDVPYGAIQYLNRDFSFDHEAYNASGLPQRTDAEMEEFAKALQSFYRDTGFEDFFLSHRDFYNGIIEKAIATMPDWNMIDAMEEYYGLGMESYNAVLCSLIQPGGFGVNKEEGEGLAIVSVMGPQFEEEGIPAFSDEGGFLNLILHEFGHSFILITEGYDDIPAIREAVNGSMYLMEPIEDIMVQSAYGNWLFAYEELVLRGAVIHIMMEYADYELEPLLEYEEEVGFIYIRDVYDILHLYTENREDYVDFNEFIPVLTGELMARYPQEEA